MLYNVATDLDPQFAQACLPEYLTLVLLNPDIHCLCSVDPDQLASEEANWYGPALFAIQYLNLYQQPGSSKLISWKLEVGVASWFIQHYKGLE